MCQSQLDTIVHAMNVKIYHYLSISKVSFDNSIIDIMVMHNKKKLNNVFKCHIFVIIMLRIFHWYNFFCINVTSKVVNKYLLLNSHHLYKNVSDMPHA